MRQGARHRCPSRNVGGTPATLQTGPLPCRDPAHLHLTGHTHGHTQTCNKTPRRHGMNARAMHTRAPLRRAGCNAAK